MRAKLLRGELCDAQLLHRDLTLFLAFCSNFHLLLSRRVTSHPFESIEVLFNASLGLGLDHGAQFFARPPLIRAYGV
jgi:hypothetical protein